MSQSAQIEVNQLTSSKISIRAETDYREARSVDPVLRCLQAGSGFLHLSPIGAGKLEAEDLKSFHELLLTIRRVLDAPDVKAFWLVALWKDHTIVDTGGDGCAAKAAQPLAPAELFDAVAYSWLFIQPPAVPDEAWRQAGAALSETSGHAAILRCRGDASASAFTGSERRLLTRVSAEEVVQAVAANAMPVSLGLGAPQRSMSGPGTTVGPLSLDAAVPHCNSSRMMFAYRGILKGGE